MTVTDIFHELVGQGPSLSSPPPPPHPPTPRTSQFTTGQTHIVPPS